MTEYNEQEWRRILQSPGGVAVAMSPQWLLNGCPTCGCKTWQVTDDCWAYCDMCSRGIPTYHPFTNHGDCLERLPYHD